MAWSTSSDGRWSSKRLASSVPAPIRTNLLPQDFYFTGWIAGDNRLYLAIRANGLGHIGRSEELDVGYFTFDDCQSAPVFVADSSLFTLPVMVPDGGVDVTGSSQYFDSRTFTGPELSFEIGADDAPELRLLLSTVDSTGARVRYAHQYGVGGSETSPFFYTNEQRSYFVRLLPDAWGGGLGSELFAEATQQRAGSGARIAPTGQTGLSTSPHYQGTNAGQIVDRGIRGFSASDEAAFRSLDTIGTILEDASTVRDVLAGEGMVSLFRYQFTRFYHPYT